MLVFRKCQLSKWNFRSKDNNNNNNHRYRRPLDGWAVLLQHTDTHTHHTHIKHKWKKKTTIERWNIQQWCMQTSAVKANNFIGWTHFPFSHQITKNVFFFLPILLVYFCCCYRLHWTERWWWCVQPLIN